MSVRALVFVFLIFTMACQTSQPQPEPVKNDWSGDMQSMAQGVKKLLPFLYDREAYQNPKNKPAIAQHLKDLSNSAQHIKPEMGKKYLGDDLLVEYSLANLNENLNRAVRSFDAGQFDYSRSVAKASLSYCFQCHSVTQAGQSAAWDLDHLQSLKLAPLEKADLLVAIRKYDKALTYMEGILASDSYQKSYAFDFESLLRRYLALIIRVENAPGRATKELEKILALPETPHYITEQAIGWRKSLKAWESEKLPRHPLTPKTLFQQIDRRFQRAADLQRFEKDHAGDVEYLRATAQLHSGLKMMKSAEDQARALLLLGRAYEVLDELGSWNLHETYYEACVNKDPRGTYSRSCYGRLEASLFMGYSGSSGTHLPPEQRERLQRLKEKVN